MDSLYLIPILSWIAMRVPEHLQHLVADYKIHLVQIAKSGSLHFHNEDVRTIFEICSLLYDHKVSQFRTVYENQAIRPDLGIVIGSIVSSNAIITSAQRAAKSKEDLPMWSAVREWETECENRGIAIGEAREERVGLFKGIISTCRDFGISEESALKAMTQQYGLSLDEARRYVKQYW